MNRLQKLAAQSVPDLVAEVLTIVAASKIDHTDKCTVIDIVGELAFRLKQADRLGPREVAP